ncbi:MAG: hypothetical protein HUM72_12570 [Dolichospermum sp.]|nr:hypothetical protein [Dolichospermum sp.]
MNPEKFKAYTLTKIDPVEPIKSSNDISYDARLVFLDRIRECDAKILALKTEIGECTRKGGYDHKVKRLKDIIKMKESSQKLLEMLGG